MMNKSSPPKAHGPERRDRAPAQQAAVRAPLKFQPVHVRRAFEEICERIREQLALGVLKPGQSLASGPYSATLERVGPRTGENYEETTAFLILARQRLTQPGGGSPVWLEEGLRTALHQDGCRLLEELLRDPDLVIEGNEARPGEKSHP